MCHNDNAAGYIIAKTACLFSSIFVLIFTLKVLVQSDYMFSSMVIVEYFHIEGHIILL